MNRLSHRAVLRPYLACAALLTVGPAIAANPSVDAARAAATQGLRR